MKNLLLVFVVLFSQVSSAEECFRLFNRLKENKFANQTLGKREPMVVYADGTTMPITRAFEKEGLLFRDISQWFPTPTSEAPKKLRQRLADEKKGKKPGFLTSWLRRYATEYRGVGVKVTQKVWAQKTPEQQLEFILERPDFFNRINKDGKDDLFFDSILTFDDLPRDAKTPDNIVVGDDLGSYEVRSQKGVTDRTVFLEQKATVETFLEGKIGHQHKLHTWPTDPAKRKAMAKKYIELLDTSTWYLFWRQVKRNPDEMESTGGRVLRHPYLGVYNRSMLDRLFKAVDEGHPEKFKNKYRMVGARAFKADPTLEGQEKLAVVPDWEMRSGNSAANRDFLDDVLEARLGSGDYSGIKDYDATAFDTSVSTRDLFSEHLTQKEIDTIERFEAKFPKLQYSLNGNAYNHFRSKLLSPLFDWGTRLNLDYKSEVLKKAQAKFAKAVLQVSRWYLQASSRATKSNTIGELREEAVERIERAAYKFADVVRLDLDFERYLTPTPSALPKLTVASGEQIDINKIDIGLEYSFRFPSEVPIKSRVDAEREIFRTVRNLQKEYGEGQVEKMSSDGHGHGLTVRYKYTDIEGRVWRLEWDGIQRDYVKGKIVNARGGHLEIPSPKYSPQDKAPEIQAVFQAARDGGQFPKRSAGGGHISVDMGPLKEMPAEVGAKKAASLIAYYESIREMVTFLWMHPFRKHAAEKIPVTPEFAKGINSFDGNWEDLARLLYEGKYFNTHVHRKPRYMEMNITGLMAPAVPEAYKKGSIDIKNKKQAWFPDFGVGRDAIEFRLFDAPANEFIAALQIKYIRAIMNKAYNSDGPVKLTPLFNEADRRDWVTNPKLFMRAAEAHFRELGLDIKEYMPLIIESYEIQRKHIDREPRTYEDYNEFLPATPKVSWNITRFLEVA